MLRDFQVAVYPNLKDDARRQLQRRLSRKGFPDTFKSEKVLTTEALARILQG